MWSWFWKHKKSNQQHSTPLLNAPYLVYFSLSFWYLSLTITPTLSNVVPSSIKGLGFAHQIIKWAIPSANGLTSYCQNFPTHPNPKVSHYDKPCYSWKLTKYGGSNPIVLSAHDLHSSGSCKRWLTVMALFGIVVKWDLLRWSYRRNS